MKTQNDYHQFSCQQLSVLAFLKNMKQYAPDNFDYLKYYGASAKEMIKFMEHPEKYGDFSFEFVCGLFNAINKTFKQYVIEPCQIPDQNEEDKIISSILMNSDSAFKSSYFNDKLINKSHLNAYLLRKSEVYKWNGWLLLNVQKKVAEMKVEMRIKFGITG